MTGSIDLQVNVLFFGAIFCLFLLVGVAVLFGVFRKKRSRASAVGGIVVFLLATCIGGAILLANLMSVNSLRRQIALTEQQTVSLNESSRSISDGGISPHAEAAVTRSSQRQAAISQTEEETLVLNGTGSFSPSAPNSQFAPVIPTTLPPVGVVSEVDSASSCDSETIPCLFSSSFGGYLFRGGAFGVLLVLAYLFLDAGRRGRYTWPMRFGTAVLFTALCMLLWNSGRLM